MPPLGLGRPSSPYLKPKRKRASWFSSLQLAAFLMILVIAGGLGWAILMQDRGSVTILPVAEVDIKQGDTVRMKIPVELVDYERRQLSFSLAGAPDEAELDRHTGEFTWSPTLAQEPGVYQMTVKVLASGSRPRSAERRLTIRLHKGEAPAKPLPTQTYVDTTPAQTYDTNPYESEADVTPLSRIDELVRAKLKELKIEPAKLCSDGVFLRRVYLDMLGTLPTAEEARKFLESKEPKKRSALVDEVLSRPEYADYWALKWSDLLRVKAEFPINLWPNAAQAYHRWLKTAFREDMRYDKFVRELLTSCGSNFRTPQVNFFRALQNKKPEPIAQAVALAFMGARAEAWPKERLAGMAVFFSQIGYKPTGEWKEEIVVWDPRKKDAAAAAPGKAPPKAAKPAADAPPAPPPAPMFPDGTVVQLPPGKDPRLTFADWLIRPENPWFTRHIVNRMWYWLLGRGIVHEPDDIRPDNPAQNPELLNHLAAEMVNSGYDMKHVFRLILNSRTYQSSPIARGDSAKAAENFAVYPLRRLEAEVIIDALCQITGTTESYMSIIPEPYTFVPEDRRSITLPDGSISSAFLEMFGRPPRDTGLESERNNRVTANQLLHLLNSSHIRNKLQKGPRMQELMQTGDAAETLYLAILSRFPTDQERGEAGGDARTVAWALINTEEFLFRH